MTSESELNAFTAPRLQNGVPVLLISLHDQYERRQDLVKRGIPQAWSTDYFPAHDMRNSCAQELHNVADIAQMQGKSGRSIRPAEVGCSMSHRAAARWLAESDEPMALVLEDDVIPNTEDWITLTNAVSTALSHHARKDAAFICHLGARRGQTAPALKRRVVLRDDQSLAFMPDLFLHIDPNRGLWRAHAYLISAGAAKRANTNEKKIMTLADDWCERRSRGWIDEVFYTGTILFRQDEDRPSTIRPADHDDNPGKPPLETSFRRRFVHFASDGSLFDKLRLSVKIQVSTLKARIQSRFSYSIG